MNSIPYCSSPYHPQGPFVHIASMVARSMGKFVASFKGIYTVRFLSPNVNIYCGFN